MTGRPLILSRVRLQLRRGGGEAERRSTAPYLMHQAVADLFGQQERREHLYRVVREWPGGRDLVVLSTTQPSSVEALPSPAHRRATMVESRSYDPAFSSDQLLDFELRINATAVVTTGDPSGIGTRRKQRVDVWESVWGHNKKTEESPGSIYGQYLRRKLMPVAEVLEVSVTERGEVQARRGDSAAPIRFVATNLIGTLRVVDPDGFLGVMATGIGRSKAFGCGLLLVSRPGTILARRYPQRAAELL